MEILFWGPQILTLFWLFWGFGLKKWLKTLNALILIKIATLEAEISFFSSYKTFLIKKGFLKMAEILILGRIWVEKRSKNTKCACFLTTYLIYYHDYLITTFLIKKENYILVSRKWLSDPSTKSRTLLALGLRPRASNNLDLVSWSESPTFLTHHEITIIINTKLYKRPRPAKLYSVK